MTSVPAQSTCEACGAPLSPGTAFCETCGRPVSQDARWGAQQPPATYQPVGPPLPYSAPSAVPVEGPTAPDLRTPPRNDLLVGSAASNETYLGNRLTYTDAGTNFDPLGNPDYQRALLGQALGTMAAWAIGSLALFLVFGIAGFQQQIAMIEENPFGFASGDVGPAPLLVIGQLLWAVWSIGLLVLFLVRKLAVQVSEWMLTVDGQAAAASPALDHMYAIISSRRTPVQIRPVHLVPNRQQPRDYLQIDEGVFTGFVSSFAYGADLFIGWTFWLNMSPGRWLLLSLQRLVSGGGGIYGSLANDQPKALREVLHSAVRQGVDLAAGNAQPLGQGTLGQRVHLTTVTL